MPLSFNEPTQLRTFLRATAEEAGRVALAHFREGLATTARTWAKMGGSPVTEADIAVDRLLRQRLSDALPEAGWLSEETTDDPIRLNQRIMWVVDPIDGTRAFAAGDPRWAVAIALMVDTRPIAGIVHAPALRSSYEAIRGHGALHNGRPLHARSQPLGEGLRIAGPKPELERVARHVAGALPQPKIPSLALRLAFVADGRLDVGVASSNAHDWDIAASDIVLSEAGAILTEADGRHPVYNKPRPTHGILVAATPQLHRQALAAFTASRRPGATT
ncbi:MULTISPECIES: 3'(2'),5'-bisphosphate nucleotidase CysQ [unclassified Chelatococcus]|uniref:inositol monophosphatase family protein n=1 Tax=unclassified Chelatococcus TaxID=2638111 RepID=UPI001BCF7908|nr:MULTISPECIES: 3'(2'),5'-bisphosphate nucleotidase CysQ [unclassified Chelatococcus]MBS7695798.1 3'(2'),5'-bisphosphate nucleotidase CysQ [Chelatococcus sp. YT9]MBX3555827.1 3'(2'),5'-bisphosphate nucleotidase CysQ [Chelatococcus sp.]